jgi:hypothetical protein
LNIYPEENRFDRSEALKLYTMGSSWFSTEDSKKGALAPGQLADLAILSADYFSIPEEEIKDLESVLTSVGGRVVYATEEHASLAPPSFQSVLTGRPSRIMAAMPRFQNHWLELLILPFASTQS